MTRKELREWVWGHWGSRLERPTLEQLRAALPELQVVASPAPPDGVVTVDGAPPNYEAAMREFFGQILAADDDAAAVQTWLTALELWLAVMEGEEGEVL